MLSSVEEVENSEDEYFRWKLFGEMIRNESIRRVNYDRLDHKRRIPVEMRVRLMMFDTDVCEMVQRKLRHDDSLVYFQSKDSFEFSNVVYSIDFLL